MNLEDIKALRLIGEDLKAGRNSSEVRSFIDIAVSQLEQFCDRKELEILRANAKDIKEPSNE